MCTSVANPRTCRLRVVSCVQAVMERRSRREHADTSRDSNWGSAPGSQSGSDSSSALPRSSCGRGMERGRPSVWLWACKARQHVCASCGGHAKYGECKQSIAQAERCRTAHRGLTSVRRLPSCFHVSGMQSMPNTNTPCRWVLRGGESGQRGGVAHRGLRCWPVPQLHPALPAFQLARRPACRTKISCEHAWQTLQRRTC